METHLLGSDVISAQRSVRSVTALPFKEIMSNCLTDLPPPRQKDHEDLRVREVTLFNKFNNNDILLKQILPLLLLASTGLPLVLKIFLLLVKCISKAYFILMH